jgi:hypothetical protein
MSYVDTSMLYHMIKSQSVIKLYLMYNMIEVADRLFSAFGQDTIDALFWTATEPRGKKREHIGVSTREDQRLTLTLLSGHSARAASGCLCLSALNACASAGHNTQRRNQCKQQGAADHHDEQQLC